MHDAGQQRDKPDDVKANQYEADRVMWLAIRRGVLAIVKAIDVRYGVESQPRKDARRAA